MSIDRFLQTHVNQNPAAIAIKYITQELTYQQLDSKVNQLANYLRKQGVKPEVLVGIYVERSLDIVIAILGVLKAGGAYVPLDPGFPQDRLGTILAETKIQLIITQSQLLPKIDNKNICLLSIDTQWSEIATENEELAPIAATPENLAYIMYTSGSTGKPQGVQVTRAQIECYLDAIGDVIQIAANDVYLHSASFAFSSSIRQLFLPLSQGATVAIVPKKILTNPIDLLKFIQTEKVTIFDTVASVWNYVLMSLDSIDSQRRSQLIQSQLRLLIFSGGLLTAQLLKNIRSEFKQPLDIVNVYGQTETIGVSAYPVSIEVDREQRYIPVGVAYPHNKLYILDDRFQPVAATETGELYVAGMNLARGYFNNPQLTDRKFISNPFSPDRERLYKTGDLARYRSDGNLEIVGRQDFQVKIRGMRVEIEEIETVITEYPDVHQAAVIGKEEQSDEQVLIAYVVANQQFQIAELRSFLKAKLPDYMMPSAFVVLDALPLTPTNKVDRKKLPLPDRNNFTVVAASDTLELQLIKIWEKILGVKPIGIKDNFFELGGHSLIALLLITEVEKIWGKHLFLSSILQSPTIAELAEVLRQKESTSSWSSLVPIELGGHKPPLFCIHPVGGNILEYYSLAGYLNQDRPIYGLQAQGIDGKQKLIDRVEEMASHFIKEIQTVQPHGPYLLIGYSFGGLLAFEMAQQLYRQGEKVNLLGLLDTRASILREVNKSFPEYLEIHLNKLRQLESLEKLKYCISKINTLFQKKMSYRDHLIANLSKIEMLSPEILNVLDCNIQAQQDYIPQVYPGKVIIFRSESQSLYRDIYPELGWKNLVSGGIECEDIPGDHYEMIREPNVRVLARKLNDWIDRQTNGSNY
jgi:amino acid adenylation domain-containing protein